MRGRSRLVAVLLLSTLAATAVLAAAQGVASSAGRTYTVAEILATVSRNPKAWDGKAVLVRGAIQPGLVLVRSNSQYFSVETGTSTIGPGYLPLADSPAAQEVLWVEYARHQGLLAWLHHIPLLGNLLPSPPALVPGQRQTYAVVLHAGKTPYTAPACVIGTLANYVEPATTGVAAPPGA